MMVPNLLVGAISAGFRIDRFIAKDARRQGTNAIPVLLEQFRAAAPTQTHLPGLSALSMLEDIVIQPLDIRRPLKVRQQLPRAEWSSLSGTFGPADSSRGTNYLRGYGQKRRTRTGPPAKAHSLGAY